MKIIKRILSIFLRISISVFLLLFLFKQIDKRSLLEIMGRLNWPLLALAFFISGFNYILAFWRWDMLLRAVNLSVSLKRLLVSYSAGIFFNLFLPSTIGGDLVRSIDLTVHTKKSQEIVATVILDRISGYVGLVILTLCALGLGWRLVGDRSVLSSVAVITAILVAILLVLFNRAIYAKVSRWRSLSSGTGGFLKYLKDLHHQIHIFQQRKRVILNSLLLSIVLQVISPLVGYIISLSLGVRINILYFLVFFPIIAAITLLPISIGGLGIREVTSIYFFSKAGLGKDLIFTLSLLNFSLLLVYAGIGGLIYILLVSKQRPLG